MENKKALYYEVGKDDEFITVDDIKEAAVEAREDYQSGKLKKYKNIQVEISAESDPFYSEVNQARLRKSVADLKEGKGTVHDLIEIADE